MKERKTENPEGRSVRIKAITTPTSVRNLQTWLRECLFSIVDGDDGALRFARVTVRQLVKGNRRGEEVLTLEVPGKAGEDWCDTAALDIHGKLSTEAATLGGLQKYALYAYHSGDNENHTSRFVIRLQNDDDEDGGDGLNSENPDKTGLVSQSMRHTEVFAKTMSGMVMALMGSYQATISRQNSMIEKLLEEKMTGMESMQEMMEAKDERDVRMIQARAKARGIEDLVGRLGVLLPAVANKVAGKAIFPVEDSSMMMMTRSLVTSIMADPERAEKLLALLPPEQGIALMNLYESISTSGKEGEKAETGLQKSE
jgi:hypothetical protein